MSTTFSFHSPIFLEKQPILIVKKTKISVFKAGALKWGQKHLVGVEWRRHSVWDDGSCKGEAKRQL